MPRDHPDRFARTTKVTARDLVGQLSRPLREFVDTEAAGALVMVLAAVLGLLWANSAWSAGYHALWEQPLALRWGARHPLDCRHGRGRHLHHRCPRPDTPGVRRKTPPQPRTDPGTHRVVIATRGGPGAEALDDEVLDRLESEAPDAGPPVLGPEEWLVDIRPPAEAWSGSTT